MRVVSIATAIDPAPYEVTDARRFVGPLHVNMRAYPDWEDSGFYVLPPGALVVPVQGTDGATYTDGRFGFFQYDGYAGWLPLAHLV